MPTNTVVVPAENGAWRSRTLQTCQPACRAVPHRGGQLCLNLGKSFVGTWGPACLPNLAEAGGTPQCFWVCLPVSAHCLNCEHGIQGLSHTSQGVPLKLEDTPLAARSTPMPLPRGKRKQDGRSSIATAVATALHSSASFDGCMHTSDIWY